MKLILVVQVLPVDDDDVQLLFAIDQDMEELLELFFKNKERKYFFYLH